MLLHILVADDHAIFRKGLKETLSAITDSARVGEAGNGRQALDMALAEDWDIVVLDVTMPEMSGLAVLRELRQARPQLPVLILSMHTGAHYVEGALKAGAAGYLSKETAPEELLSAVEQIMAGSRYVSPRVSRGLGSNTP